jgi:Metallo-peptidase family M12
MSLSASSVTRLSALGSMASATAGAMTAAQAMTELNAKRLTQPVVVEDSQANLQANLANLQKLAALGKLSALSFTDNATSLQFSAAQINTSSALLGKAIASGVTVQVVDTAGNTARMASRISTAFEVTVIDTAANIGKNLTGLQTLAVTGKLDTLTFTDSAPALTMKASQFGATAALRAKMSGVDVTVSDTAANVAKVNVASASGVTIKDSAANVLRNFEAMRTLAATGPSMTVTLTDHAPVMALTAAQYVGSADLRAKLQGVTYTIKDNAQAIADNASALSGLKVSVTDTAANVQSNLDALQTFADAGNLSLLKVTDASKAKLSMTAAQALKMGALSGSAITLTDTAANIQANFDGLLAVKKINAIQLTDTARPVLQVTEAQYKKGAALLAKVSGAAVSVQFSGNMANYKIKANADGSFAVGNATYKKVNFFAFQDTTAFADTGDANVNAMLLGGTNYWWRDTAGGVTTSDTQIKTNVFSLGEGSSRQSFTYSFMTALPDGNTSDSTGFRAMSNTQQSAVRRAFDYLSSIINVTFTESNSAGQADINFGTNNQSTKGSSGYANLPNGSGDHPVYLFLDNSPGNANTTMTQGSYGWETLIHEIGHTLGLKHPGNYNASGGAMPGPYLSKALDSRLYTLMSYNNPTGSLEVSSASLPSGATRYSASTVNPSTYMMFDMAALQFMYGVGNGQGTSDYQVTSFNADWSGMQTLWMPEDGVIDASAVSNANIIDLRAGAFSSINVIPKSITDSFPASLKTAATYMGLNNVGLAYGSQVVTAKGGAAGDVFYTSAAADVTIDGGDGNDTVYLAGTAADWVQSQGTYTNAKLSRSVSLSNVEVVKFYNADTYATTHSRLDLSA